MGSLGDNFIGEAKKRTDEELILLCCAVSNARAREGVMTVAVPPAGLAPGTLLLLAAYPQHMAARNW